MILTQVAVQHCSLRDQACCPNISPAAIVNEARKDLFDAVPWTHNPERHQDDNESSKMTKEAERLKLGQYTSTVRVEYDGDC